MLNLSSNMVTWVTIILLGSMVGFSYFMHSKIYAYINKKYNELCHEEVGYLPPDMKEKIVLYMKNNKQKLIQTQTLVEEYISEWYLEEGETNARGKKPRRLVTLSRFLKSLPSKMIIIGVLGTFIGLVISLSEIAQIAQAADNIMGVVAGMNVAFYTSIAGIISSLAMQGLFMWKNTDAILNLYMLKLELHINMHLEDYKSDAQMNKLDEINNNIKEVAEGMGALRELDAVAKQLNKFNVDFKTNITDLTRSLEGSTSKISAFSEQLIALGGKFDGLINAFESHNEVNQGVIQYMKGTYSSIQETLQGQRLMNEGLRTTFEQNTLLAKQNEQQMLQIYNKSMESQQYIVEKTNNLINDLARGYEEQMTKLNSQVIENVEGLLMKSNNVFSYVIKEYQETMNELHGKITEGFDKQFEQVRQSQEDTTSLVVNQIRAIADQHKEHTKQVFENNTEQMALLQKAYSEMSTVVVDSAEAISRKLDVNENVLSQLTTNYGNLEKEQQHLIEETQQMIDVMQEYVTQLKGALRDDIKDTIKEMQEHTKIMNQTILKKIQNIDYEQLTNKFIETYDTIQKHVV